MKEKIEVMVALGAAIGVNCIPCFDHLYSRAKGVGLDDTEIKNIVEVANKVKNGAASFLNQAVGDMIGEVKATEQSCCGPTKSSCCG